jgi:hypothetical protein
MGYGNGSVEELQLDPDEESLYDKARALEFGDWNVSRCVSINWIVLMGIVSCDNCT